jgi:hypothetical protein
VQVAKALGLKIFVERDKWNVLQCLDLPATERTLLTRNINEAGLHVVRMGQVRSEQKYDSDFAARVGVWQWYDSRLVTQEIVLFHCPVTLSHCTP